MIGGPPNIRNPMGWVVSDWWVISCTNFGNVFVVWYNGNCDGYRVGVCVLDGIVGVS